MEAIACECSNKLPKIMHFLLERDRIKQKSFQQYLRRGITPDISEKILWNRANRKKLQSTCSLEFDFERSFFAKINNVIPRIFIENYRGISGESHIFFKENSGDDYLKVLEIIYKAMLNAEQAAINATDEHRLSFDGQIREKFGIIPYFSEESYLEVEIKRFELQLLQTLERLANRMERLFKCRNIPLPVGEYSANLPLPVGAYSPTLLTKLFALV